MIASSLRPGSRNPNYADKDGYGCLDAGEAWADWLGDNYYYKAGSGPSNISMNDSISSHQWVYASGCAGGWIT